MTAGPHRSRWQSTANSQGHISANSSGARARGSLASQVAKASLLDLKTSGLDFKAVHKIAWGVSRSTRWA